MFDLHMREPDFASERLPVEISEVEDQVGILHRKDLPVRLVVEDLRNVLPTRRTLQITLVDDLANAAALLRVFRYLVVKRDVPAL